jgi:citrate lyase gamma subunit
VTFANFLSSELIVDKYIDGALDKSTEIMICNNRDADIKNQIKRFIHQQIGTHTDSREDQTSSTDDIENWDADVENEESLIYVAVPVVLEAKLLNLLNITAFSVDAPIVVKRAAAMDLGSNEIRKRIDPLESKTIKLKYK